MIGLDKHLPKIPRYVAKPAEVAAILNDQPGVVVEPKHPPTNMMHAYFQAPSDRVMEAVGQIALEEKVALLYGAQETARGAKSELCIGEAALEIPAPRLHMLLSRLCESITTPAHGE